MDKVCDKETWGTEGNCQTSRSLKERRDNQKRLASETEKETGEIRTESETSSNFIKNEEEKTLDGSYTFLYWT